MSGASLPSALAYKYTRVYKLKGLSEGIGSFCPWSADVPGRAGRDALSRVHLIRIVNACHGLPAPDPSSCGSHQRSICVPCGDLEVSLVSVSPNPALAPTDTMLCSAITVVALSSSSDCGLARAIPLALNCYATVRIHILEHYTPLGLSIAFTVSWCEASACPNDADPSSRHECLHSALVGRHTHTR